MRQQSNRRTRPQTQIVRRTRWLDSSSVNRHPLSARLRYAFDNFMSRGTIALIAGLFVLSLLVIITIATFIVISGTLRESQNTEGIDFAQAVWMSLLRTLDPGTMGGDTGSVVFVLSMLTVTLGGIFIVATLIGIISNGIQGKLDDLRKGRSQVLEDGHTVILGWSAQIFDIIGEIVTANENKRRQRIVVLAERDKVEMEDDIRARIPNTKTTRVVCRSGSPIDVADLAIASVHTARSVIVLAPELEDPDTEVVKTLLALTSDALLPGQRGLQRRRRDPRRAQCRRCSAGEPRPRAARAQWRSHRPHRGPNLSPARPVGRVHGPARLCRRRDLFRR